MQRTRGALIVVWSIMLVVSAPVALATNYDAQIESLNNQINSNKSAAAQKQAEANTLANKVASINAQLSSAQAALNRTRIQATQTQADIDAKTVDLEHQKVNLRQNLATMYKGRDVTPLEVLASSQNLSDYVSKQQYVTQVKDKLEANIASIDALKLQLEKKKADLAAQAQNEQGQVASIGSLQAEQQSLLNNTKGQEAAYQSLVAQNQSQLTAVFAARAAEIARSRAAGGSFRAGGQCGGGYPNVWCQASQDSLVDDYGYYNRECVSYVAWKRASLGKWVPMYWGNAGDWWGRGSADISPQYGDIVVWPYGGSSPFGHVAIVESNNGGSISVSEYNYSPRGGYEIEPFL